MESGAERVMEPIPTIKPIPAAIVLGILSLGVKNPRYNPNDPRFGPKVRHVGSGVVVEYQGQRFLATAYHVAEPCGFAPLVREWGEWKKWLWGPAVVDKGSDIAMIQDLDQKRDPAVKVDEDLSTQPAYGEVGRAIGFPRVSLEEYESSIWMTGQYKGLPIPVNVPITASLWEIEKEEEKPVIRMAGGYINGGFSGGQSYGRLKREENQAPRSGVFAE